VGIKPSTSKLIMKKYKENGTFSIRYKKHMTQRRATKAQTIENVASQGTLASILPEAYRTLPLEDEVPNGWTYPFLPAL
jgi:hypothetical protein